MRRLGSLRAVSEPRPTLAVGAIVVRDGRLLMVRRGREPGRGLWSLPGGRVEAGESLSEAVRREVKEETGLDVAVGELAGVYEVPAPDHLVVLDYFAVAPADQAPRAGTDADEAGWVPFERIRSLECTPRLIETLTGWGVFPGPGVK